MARPDRPRQGLSRRILAVGAVIAALAGGPGGTGPATAEPPEPAGHGSDALALAYPGWIWPSASFRFERPYEAPAHRYAGGHRGVDLRPIGAVEVRAPADGSVAFVGLVAERGVLTIDHGNGLVTTLEPVESALTIGDEVRRGDVVGTVALGGHAAAGAFHFGVRLHGDYVNPQLLLGGVPRAVLLPCC